VIARTLAGLARGLPRLDSRSSEITAIAVPYLGNPCGSTCFDEENAGLWHELDGLRTRLRAITRKTLSASKPPAVCDRSSRECWRHLFPPMNDIEFHWRTLWVMDGI
jgi:hypothetical protein